MSLIDMYVRDKYTGESHKVGTDPHDSIWVSSKGVVHYMNLQNGDGASGDGLNDQNGYEFMPSDCGEINDENGAVVFICSDSEYCSDDTLEHDIRLANAFIKRTRARDEKI